MTTPARVRPAIVLVVATEHIPVVESEFGRYARDYDILCADDAAGGRELVRQALEDGQPVALLGVGWVVPGVDVGLDLLDELHTLLPAARRICLTSRGPCGISR